jgi:lipopolysaccharide/colanic/teichoic acid biosynthesis glycosyltransferase
MEIIENAGRARLAEGQSRRHSSAFAKRIFDLVAASCGLLLLAPLLLVIAILIKLDSRGPVFYRGVRVGLNGRLFRIFKFRTMTPDAERLGGTATSRRDPRVTRVGRWLRVTKFDEFPQLLNVISGEMSIVGPRPEVEEHTGCYTDEEKIILSAKPGITDEASIRFYNLSELLDSEDPTQLFVEKYRSEKNRLRVQYVKQQSFTGDLSLIFRTFYRLIARG